ncbi:hypothetical protein Asp14428_32740 [Actinoplanes sp. NBRC 14428]|nr:hypothetical protein Asp14428_32740 [Actinoplanes sp. NBRC 14428]
MTRRWTHGRSTRHSGAACGATSAQARITDEAHLVTCPDCPDAAEAETIPDDATTGDPHLIETLRDARDGHTHKIDGVVLDAATAHAILTVYDAATPKTKAKIAGPPLTVMTSLAWNILRADTEKEGPR